MERVTKPDELREAAMRVWSMMPLMGRVLLPGTRVMSLMVALPTTPFWAVDMVRVTLPSATVMTDGLGMYAKPLRLGSPGVAVLLMVTPVTLNPFKPFIPMLVSFQMSSNETMGRLTLVCAGRVEVDVDDGKFSFVQLGLSRQGRTDFLLRDESRCIICNLVEVCNRKVQVRDTDIRLWV